MNTSSDAIQAPLSANVHHAVSQLFIRLITIGGEDLLDVLAKEFGYLECQRQAGFVLFRFNSIDRLARNTELFRQICL